MLQVIPLATSRIGSIKSNYAIFRFRIYNFQHILTIINTIHNKIVNKLKIIKIEFGISNFRVFTDI